MSVRDWRGTAKMTVKKLGEIIGTTGDMGGTATAGTLMAKVNEIIGKTAKEKTAEEILEKIKNTVDNREFLHVTTETVTATPISIQGKGRIYYAKISQALRGATSTTPEMQIIIDGTVVLTNNGYVTSNGTTATVVNFANWRYIRDYTNEYLFDTEQIDITSDMDDPEFDAENPITLKGTSGNNGYTFRVKDFIEFNESFEIKLTGCSAASASGVYLCYSLEE